MYCVKCGAELPEDANYCSKCGEGVNGKDNVQTELNKVMLAYTRHKLLSRTVWTVYFGTVCAVIVGAMWYKLIGAIIAGVIYLTLTAIVILTKRRKALKKRRIELEQAAAKVILNQSSAERAVK